MIMDFIIFWSENMIREKENIKQSAEINVTKGFLKC